MKSKMIGDKVIHNVGKGSKDEVLPSRMAMETVTKGSPMQRSMNYYGKKMRPEDIARERMMRSFGMADVSGPYS